MKTAVPTMMMHTATPMPTANPIYTLLTGVRSSGDAGLCEVCDGEGEGSASVATLVEFRVTVITTMDNMGSMVDGASVDVGTFVDKTGSGVADGGSVDVEKLVVYVAVGTILAAEDSASWIADGQSNPSKLLSRGSFAR